MAQDKNRINPLVAMIEHAETEEYRCEMAMTAAVFYEERLGPDHPGVLQFKTIAIMSGIKRIPQSVQLAMKQWTKERSELKFWQRIRTPHTPTEEYLEEWAENERMRAFMDASEIIGMRGNELF